MTLRNCDWCETQYEAKTAKSRFCSPRCRLRNHEQRGPQQAAARAAVAELPPPTSGAVLQATRAALEAAGRAESPLGAAALALAGRVDTGQHEPGSAFAALVREHRAALVEALRGANAAANPLDELRALRDRKRAG